MAIKTKKISDLGEIKIDGSTSLEKSDFYFLGCLNGITGKVSTQDIVQSIRSGIVAETNESAEFSRMRSSMDEVSSLSERIVNNDVKIDNLTSTIETLSASVATIASTPATVSTSCGCEEKIAALEAKVAALEGFVQALQADGYLTLANIKKAAAEACPICNHTHEEEQSAE